MAKETSPKNTALENDILKAAGNTAAPVNQQAVKDQAQAIADQANKASGETIAGKVETMPGQPGPGTQVGESNLPPVKTDAEVDEDYEEYKRWKAKKLADQALEGDRLSAEYQEQEKKEAAAELAAKKAYEAVMQGQAQETDAQALHNERVRMYGEGYTVATRKGVTQIFTRQTWKLLGGRNNQDGYTEVVETPPEIANLKKAK
jgi:hypothetical protein